MKVNEFDFVELIMDMGQCNDAYSAVKVAVALFEAFSYTVFDISAVL